MIDLDAPVPALPQCAAHHVACVEVVDTDGRRWCWGWCLIAWDPDWPALVASPEYFWYCIENLAAELAVAGHDLTRCTWTGRGL